VPRHVAFLGGINVGGHRVTMERLRNEFASLGFSDVSTYIASGNVLFTAPGRGAHDDRIGAHLAAQLGWPVPTYVRTAAEVIAAVELRPFGTIPEGSTHMIAFCRTEPDHAVESLSNDVERFEVHGHDVHWLIAGGTMSSTIGLSKLGKALGQPCTTRNTKGMGKLADLLR
jgi:uncharacterized protein (DUF1697 family)